MKLKHIWQQESRFHGNEHNIFYFLRTSQLSTFDLNKEAIAALNTLIVKH